MEEKKDTKSFEIDENILKAACQKSADPEKERIKEEIKEKIEKFLKQ